MPILKTKVPAFNFKNIERETANFKPAFKVVEDNEPIKKAYDQFPFNPNDVSFDDLMRLGLSQRVSTTLIHYRNKGGHFYKKEDLKRIYGFSSSDYERLEPFIQLKNAEEKNVSTTFNSNEISKNQIIQNIVLQKFDPNTASEYTLLSLGLEIKTVKNMLKYRENKGIFHHKEDLRKIYTFSEIDFLRLEPYIQIADNQTDLRNSTTNMIHTEKFSNKMNANQMLDLNAHQRLTCCVLTESGIPLHNVL